jgi:hypothetical protein
VDATRKPSTAPIKMPEAKLVRGYPEYRGHACSGANYFFSHIRDEVDCLDKSASIYIEKTGYLGDFRKLAIDESKIRGNNLFRWRMPIKR